MKAFVWFITSSLLSVHLSAGLPTTATIRTLTQSAILSCSHYMKPAGKCFFYDPKTESINTTWEIAHYQPDIIVAVYNQPGEIPWVEMRQKHEFTLKRILANAFPGQPIGGGHLSTQAGRTEVFFKEAAAYGCPESLAFKVAKPFLCARANVPESIHFHSESDHAAWRLGTTSINHEPFLGKVGMQQTWGTLLPTTGFVVSASPPWAGASIASRVAYLVTGGEDRLITIPHRINPIPKKCPGSGCESFVMGGDKLDAAFWQAIYPTQTKTCGVFGDGGAIDTALFLSHPPEEGLLLALWRCYRCCEPGKGVFVRKVSWAGCGS